ncbi:hypothetical protein [Sphingomonas sp. IW22]|uniref:hypothetical protein n=1 Tax=Sphingomonas sp. IW22 TaxID=3242489 RepID=UPI003520E2D0
MPQRDALGEVAAVDQRFRSLLGCHRPPRRIPAAARAMADCEAETSRTAISPLIAATRGTIR